MAPLDSITKISFEQELATTFMDVIPRAMGEIRHGLRSQRKAEFSVPQFRTMMKLRKGPCTNSELADHIGLSVAAMSRLIQGLVTKGFLEKKVGLEDRREVCVQLSKRGALVVQEIRDNFRHDLSQVMVKKLDSKEKQDLYEGFLILKKLLNNDKGVSSNFGS